MAGSLKSTAIAADVGTAPSARTAFTTHVVLPAYNEAGSLPPLLERLGELADGWQDVMKVWVVDDGSDDDTAQIARRGDERVEVTVVSHPVNLGLGQAVHSGLRAV